MKYHKDKKTVQILINSGSEVNIMPLVYAAVLGLKVYPTAVGAQKIDGFSLKTFSIVIASF